jgi:hypothetical protein
VRSGAQTGLCSHAGFRVSRRSPVPSAFMT